MSSAVAENSPSASSVTKPGNSLTKPARTSSERFSWKTGGQLFVQFQNSLGSEHRRCDCGTFATAIGTNADIVPRDEVSETLANLEINLWLNGELRQSAPSSQLIWKPAETISYISNLIDLKRGDLLLTGTPGGVTAPASPKLIDILKTHLMDDEARRGRVTR